ncbi:MAG: methyltransferase [Actinomycetia bacterium]|nr:methyltransferase [Actinomycetes bacterium]MCP4227544.1 methyltransferase [Actinomycetes bacterium]MCP5033156.1 methyltransferase [Actinomycetes bacterium]
MTEESRRRRSGGRAARIANHQAPATTATRPVWPGLPGGRFSPLTESAMQQVYDTALLLLETVGMGSPITEFIEVVTEAGGWLDDEGRLHYPRGVVERAIDTAAKDWIWHGFDDDRSIEVGGTKVHFGTAGAAVFMLEHETNTFRQSTARDLYDCARLVDTLDNIHFFVRTVVAGDIEDSRELDLTTAYAVMAGTTKPGGTSFFDPAHVYEAAEMFDLAAGGPGRFARRPFIVANNTFVVPPMRFAEESAHCMVAQVKTGMPINLLSAGQAGATSPAALAGSLAQALAECLAALTTVNLFRPGHPCVMGLWPFVSDLRTGAMSGGSGEEGVLNAAAAQVTNWLGLPSGVAAGMADAKVPDNQAGYEKGLNVALAGHAGANLVYESAGMLASLLTCSLESMVIDNDMMGSINRTIRGIEVNEQTLSADLIAEVVSGPGHFLGSHQTLELMRSEYLYPLIGDREAPNNWLDAGAKDARQTAHEMVGDVLGRHRPRHIAAGTDEAIRARFPIRLDLSDEA